MARATSNEVIGIMSEVPIGTNLDAFISVASCIILDNLDETLFSAETLKNIEMYLAAHLAAIGKFKQTIESELGGTNRAKDKYGFMLGKGLQLTTYGQMVVMLDASKVLGSMSESKRKVSFGILEEDRSLWINT